MTVFLPWINLTKATIDTYQISWYRYIHYIGLDPMMIPTNDVIHPSLQQYQDILPSHFTSLIGLFRINDWKKNYFLRTLDLWIWNLCFNKMITDWYSREFSLWVCIKCMILWCKIVYHVKWSYQKMYQTGGWQWVGGGPEPLLILDFSIQCHHLHICISTSDLDKVVGGLKQFRNWSKCGEFCCFTTRRKA